MLTWGKTISVLLLAASLGGCAGSDASEKTSAASAAPTPSKTATPTPTPSAATENEVASVIAGYEKDWREVIDEAGKCRIAWVMKDSDPAEGARRLACYTRETTAGTTAQLAIRDLGALTIPDSMRGLVDETTTALQAVADVELEAVCGEAFDGPKDSKACSEALGSRMWTYDSLERVLDKWSPYL